MKVPDFDDIAKKAIPSQGGHKPYNFREHLVWLASLCVLVNVGVGVSQYVREQKFDFLNVTTSAVISTALALTRPQGKDPSDTV